MNNSSAFRAKQTGGITILVCLMLLVLLTVAAFGMSRNAIREVLIVGSERQGVEVRNVADSGLDWSIDWIDQRSQRTMDPGSTLLVSTMKELWEPQLQGTPRAIATVDGSAMTSTVNGVTRKYDLQMIQMGQLEMPMVSQTPGVVVQNPVMWSMRSNATMDYGTMNFKHSREAWVLAPPPGSTGQ